MAAEDNRRLLHSYVTEVWENANLGALPDFLADDFRRHVSPTLPPLDRDGQIQRLTALRAAIPDIKLRVEDVVADDERIAFRSIMTGTHRGTLGGLPPTEKPITVGLVDVIRVEEGRFAEQWGGPDMADLFRQLGAVYRIED